MPDLCLPCGAAARLARVEDQLRVLRIHAPSLLTVQHMEELRTMSREWSRARVAGHNHPVRVEVTA